MPTTIEEYQAGKRDFRGADLSGADLSGADLSDANLSGADLSGANLIRADLSGANLSDANLSGADLSGADLSGANLIRANLSGANLIRANLSGANLIRADLSGANLIRANLSGANLSGADLSDANLSGAKGLFDAIAWLEQLERDSQGLIVYKVFGLNYAVPEGWKIEPGAIITENVNPCPTSDCACGVNVATWEWVQANKRHDSVIWKCRIRWEWLVNVVVPYRTDGKIRTARLELLEVAMAKMPVVDFGREVRE